MSISRRLASLLALALAAIAVAAAPAFATTVTPAGNYSGTVAAGMLTSDNGTVITCEDSDFAATVEADGTVLLTSLTFSNCIEPLLELSCTVTVTTVNPATSQTAALNGDFASPRSTWTQATVSEAATIRCGLGTVVCEASTDTTLSGTVGNTESDNTWVNDDTSPEVTIDAGSIACGSTATWTQSWDINSPASYTITA